MFRSRVATTTVCVMAWKKPVKITSRAFSPLWVGKAARNREDRASQVGVLSIESNECESGAISREKTQEHVSV